MDHWDVTAYGANRLPTSTTLAPSLNLFMVLVMVICALPFTVGVTTAVWLEVRPSTEDTSTVKAYVMFSDRPYGGREITLLCARLTHFMPQLEPKFTCDRIAHDHFKKYIDTGGEWDELRCRQ